MICEVITEKLPEEIFAKLEDMKDPDISWSVKTLSQKLSILVRRSENSALHLQPKENSHREQTNLSSGPSTRNPSDPPICIFCGDRHFSSSCPKVKDLQARKDMIIEQGRCLLCLRKGHVIYHCPQNTFHCFNCNQVGKHNRAICPSLFQTPTTGLSVMDSFNPISEPNSSRKKVMLSTATVSITNSIPFQSPPISARILLDNANQRSYIKASLAAKLGLSQSSSETLQVKVFMGHTHSLKTRMVNFSLFEKDGTPFPISANVVSEIANGVERFNLNPDDKTFLQSFPEDALADVPPNNLPFSPDILIGADYYWKFVTGPLLSKPQQLPSGLFLIPSRFGWIISGMDESSDSSPEPSIQISQKSPQVLFSTVKSKKETRTKKVASFFPPGRVLTETKGMIQTKTDQTEAIKGRKDYQKSWSPSFRRRNGSSVLESPSQNERTKLKKEDLDPGILTQKGHTSLSAPECRGLCHSTRKKKT